MKLTIIRQVDTARCVGDSGHGLQQRSEDGAVQADQTVAFQADERLREITCRSDINQILVAIFVIGATHQWTSKSVGFDGLDVVPGEEQVVQLRRQGQ